MISIYINFVTGIKEIILHPFLYLINVQHINYLAILSLRNIETGLPM
jgi:hypothetical protein